jgi:hypothetical protein
LRRKISDNVQKKVKGLHKENKSTKKGNKKKWYCCSLCTILKKILDSKYETENIVDEDSIYSPEHELKNNEFGARRGELYVKAELIEDMLKEAKVI